MLRYQASQPTIKHFSHPHTLVLHNPQIHPPLTANSPPCACCKTPLSGHWQFYTCSIGCNFLLHAWCTQQPGRITHLAHGSHCLDLLPKPAYKGGRFKCDGCGLHGDGFSFHCSVDGCYFDLHVACAAMPARFSHRTHHHELSLMFSTPYEGKAFFCNVCGGTGLNQWVYHCRACDFDSHLGCVVAATATDQSGYLDKLSTHTDNHWTHPVTYSSPVVGTPVGHYNPPPPAVQRTHAGKSLGAPILAAVFNGLSHVILQSLLS